MPLYKGPILSFLKLSTFKLYFLIFTFNFYLDRKRRFHDLFLLLLMHFCIAGCCSC
jgi:hypothetical protein